MSVFNKKNKNSKLSIVRVSLYLLILLFFLGMQKFSCANTSDKLGEISRSAEKELFIELENIDSSNTDEEYAWRKKIENSQEAINTIVASYIQVNKFYNELTRYLILREMFGPALKIAQEALQVTPNDARLHYSAGVCAANLSKVPNTGQRDFYLDMAEQYYLSALRLEPRKTEALYAIAVFYTFERENLAEGMAYSKQLLAVRSGDIRGRFLLAHILVGEGNVAAAIEEYQKLRSMTNITDSQKQTIDNNIQELKQRGANVQ